MKWLYFSIDYGVRTRDRLVEQVFSVGNEIGLIQNQVLHVGAGGKSSSKTSSGTVLTLMVLAVTVCTSVSIPCVFTGSSDPAKSNR